MPAQFQGNALKYAENHGGAVMLRFYFFMYRTTLGGTIAPILTLMLISNVDCIPGESGVLTRGKPTPRPQTPTLGGCMLLVHPQCPRAEH